MISVCPNCGLPPEAHVGMVSAGACVLDRGGVMTAIAMAAALEGWTPPPTEPPAQ